MQEELIVKEKEICKSKEIIEDYNKMKSDEDALEKDISEMCMENDLRERGILAIKKEMKKETNVVFDVKTVQTDVIVNQSEERESIKTKEMETKLS